MRLTCATPYSESASAPVRASIRSLPRPFSWRSLVEYLSTLAMSMSKMMQNPRTVTKALPRLEEVKDVFMGVGSAARRNGERVGALDQALGGVVFVDASANQHAVVVGIVEELVGAVGRA